MITILGVTALALSFLFWLIYFRDPITTSDMGFVKLLPVVNAFLNLLAAFFLIRGYFQIKGQKKIAHEKSMKLAFLCSALFLVSYIIYHFFHGDTKFLGQGFIRPIYFFILISHILLSVIALPMVLMTFFLALKKRWVAHKKIAKWTFPIWLYVSVTGVLIFLLLKIFN